MNIPRDFVWCGWCRGKGCVACYDARKKREEELDEEYKRQFPNGPQPIFTARHDSPEEMEQLKKVLHRDAIEKAFGEGGGGIEEIVANCEREMASRQQSELSKEERA